MDAALKYKIVERIINTDDDAVLQEVQALLEMESDDFWNTLPKEAETHFDEACEQLDRGEGIPHEEVMEEAKRLFGKK
ncbi:hypothetical protein [Mucilaginibacter terrae]|uniref:Addiction module protein n=1 Tax=Mucilaginibacter terrae TaxID=1955052 RepID=A0ABU3GVN9_9SPHI|nr:hypothetical protein [Mucilaginibacter terrae]MDT3403829.1 hypothetical protein [Mucilaginibacter terrae]